MSAHVARLSRLFTPEYVKRINAQIVQPAESTLDKPSELEPALGRPLLVSLVDGDKGAAHFAATLAHSIITAKPFRHGNQRTGESVPLPMDEDELTMSQRSSLQMSTSARWEFQDSLMVERFSRRMKGSQTLLNGRWVQLQAS